MRNQLARQWPGLTALLILGGVASAPYITGHPEPIRSATDLSAAFKEAIRKASPSVVHIDSVVEIPQRGEGSPAPEELLRQFPFGDELRRFFENPGRGGFPPQQSQASGVVLLGDETP